MENTILKRVLNPKRLLLFLSLLLLNNISSFAVQLQIGEYTTFRVSPPEGWINTANWQCSRGELVLVKSGDACQVWVANYFSDQITVTCTAYYSYQTYYNGRTHIMTGSFTRSFYVTCVRPTITLTPTEATVQPGEQVHLKLTTSPTASPKYPIVRWTFSDYGLAGLNLTNWDESNGYSDVYVDTNPNGSGTCIVTADIGGGLTASCTITIAGKEPESVSLPSTATVKVGETISLTPTLSPSNANTTYSWSSDNTSIATVNKDGDIGKVTGKNEGTATITVTTANGKTANCKVTVSPPNGIAINAKNFPDANFREYLLKQTWGKDAILEDDEIEGIEDLELDNLNINNLKGIECFASLKYLYCSNNRLSSLDVSGNTALRFFSCSKNQLTSLDVSRNTALQNLRCDNNQLSSLDVSRNRALGLLSCNDNQLSSLDVSGNTALSFLSCSKNQLSSLDVSKNTALKDFSCDNNQLSSLDVSENTALESLYCYLNQLTSLDVSRNTALTSLRCSGNQLSSLDVSKNTALKYFYCYDNQLSSLDVSSNTALTTLWCYNNQLSSLDVSENTALESLYCYLNQLTSLDVSRNTALTSLRCSGNQLSSLDVSKNTALRDLDCGDNPLSSLDVSENTALESLYCYLNQLTSLDVSKNTSLASLSCANNQLSTLDVSRNTALTYLNCAENIIVGVAMDNLINSLPQKMSGDAVFRVFNNSDGNECNVCTKALVATAKAKGWTPQYYNGTEWLEYEGIDETGIECVINDELKVSTIYNLAGQHLATPMKGINVINGRKIIVK